MGLWMRLKRLLGWAPVHDETEPKKVGVEKDIGPDDHCPHTDVEEETRTYSLPINNWELLRGHLLIPQETVDLIKCNQCNRDLAWETEKADTLVFNPSFTIAPETDLDDALAALADGSAESEGRRIIINESEQEADDAPAKAGGPTDD